MQLNVDQQTKRIIEHLIEREPQYVSQIYWSTKAIIRIIDFCFLGAIGRFLLEYGKRASGTRAIGLLSKAISVTCSKKVMAKALFYRGNYLFDGAADADRSIADLSLAIWCVPSDCWARKDRATIYEMYGASYGKGDKDFDLPMTLGGACTDAEAAILFFRSLAERHPSQERRGYALRMMQQCVEVLEKLKLRVQHE
jgi:hypothetical protein